MHKVIGAIAIGKHCASVNYVRAEACINNRIRYLDFTHNNGSLKADERALRRAYHTLSER